MNIRKIVYRICLFFVILPLQGYNLYARHPGGYATPEEGGGLRMHFYTHDHQGNVRVVMGEDGTLEQVTHYYPFGGIYGDAGLNAELQPCKYNGKELDRMHGLDWYDYGARQYDAAGVPMFTTIDPMAEKYYHLSPYAYCANNPVKYVDENGEWIWSVVGVLVEYGSQVYKNYQDGNTGYDAWVGKVDFLDVGLSAINPAGKLSLLKTVAVEGMKQMSNYKPNIGFEKETDVTKVLTNTIINTTANVGTGKLVRGSSKAAMEEAGRAVDAANRKAMAAGRRLERHPNSPNMQAGLEAAQGEVQQARGMQVGTQMLHSTVGQIKPEIVEQSITTTVSFFNLGDDERKKY